MPVTDDDRRRLLALQAASEGGESSFVGDVQKSFEPGVNKGIGEVVDMVVRSTIRALLPPIMDEKGELNRYREGLQDQASGALSSAGDALGFNRTPAEGTTRQRLMAETGRGMGAGVPFGPGAMIPAAAGGFTGGVAKEAGAGPIGQAVAGIAGSMGAGAVQNFAAKAVSGVPSAKLQAYQQEGVTPRVAIGEGMGNFVARQTTAGMRDAPVTGGIIQRAAQESIDDLQRAVERRASQFGAATTKTEGGEAITKGVESFTERVSKTGEKLYGALGRAMPPTTPVNATNTIQTIGGLNSVAQEMPETAAILTPRIFEAIKNDLTNNNGVLSFKTISRVRTEIGQKLANPMLIDDIGRRDARLLYEALSRDMEAAVKGTNAEQLFKISNAFWKQQMTFIENSFAKLQKAGATPESIFNWATAEGKSGASRLLQLRKAMGPREFENITAVVTRSLGRLGSDDGAFSPARFVTNWGNLSGDAKRVLYANPDYRASMDRLAEIAKDMQKTGALANTSRTAGTSQLFSMVTGLAHGAVGIGAGPATAVGTFAAQVAGQATLSKLLTSPGFVRWLATDVGPNGIGAHLKILPQIAMREPQIAGEIEEFLKGVAAVGDIQE